MLKCMLRVYNWQFAYNFLIYFQFPMQLAEVLHLSICPIINFNIRLAYVAF